MPSGQDLVDATVHSISEHGLDQVHCSAACAAIVVACHEDEVPVMPIVIHPIDPIVPESTSAAVERTVCVHEEHCRAGCVMLQANPIHPPLSPLVLPHQLGTWLSNWREGCSVPCQGGRIGIGPLEEVEVAHTRILQDGGYVLALLEADQIERAFFLDASVQGIPSVVLLDIPPVCVVGPNDNVDLVGDPGARRICLAKGQIDALHRMSRPLNHGHAGACYARFLRFRMARCWGCGHALVLLRGSMPCEACTDEQPQKRAHYKTGSVEGGMGVARTAK
mmetsp:Transcript_10926/g.27212  ORF Transcript_10926/g.27212 Transcript_10926/m.27212 type:complete len:278 (+) Transcript_10926:507-1340(+)